MNDSSWTWIQLPALIATLVAAVVFYWRRRWLPKPPRHSDAPARELDGLGVIDSAGALRRRRAGWSEIERTLAPGLDPWSRSVLHSLRDAYRQEPAAALELLVRSANTALHATKGDAQAREVFMLVEAAIEDAAHPG